jgi:predicted acylesterase/phospholipase RssA
MTRVNLALGGGGAKGFVHAGVIEEIVAQGYEIGSIVGTSMGALVGALFAYEVSIHRKNEPNPQKTAAETVRKILLQTDFTTLLDINWKSLLSRGAMKGRRIREWFDDQFYDESTNRGARFADLKMLTVTVTNALNGDSVALNYKTAPATLVSRAIRASISIQGVFIPEEIDVNGQRILCWDGGVTGNCRFDLAHEQGGDLTVASSVTYRGDFTSPSQCRLTAFLRPFQVFNRSADIWLMQIERLTEKLLGEEAMRNIVVVRPDLDGVGTLDFRIPERRRKLLMDNGRAQAKAELERFAGKL